MHMSTNYLIVARFRHLVFAIYPSTACDRRWYSMGLHTTIFQQLHKPVPRLKDFITSSRTKPEELTAAMKLEAVAVGDEDAGLVTQEIS